MNTGRVNLFDNPIGSQITLEDTIKGVVKEIPGFVVFGSLTYLLACVMFCAQAGTEYTGAYVPIWHWPLKLITLL
jgi:hypothetical protein